VDTGRLPLGRWRWRLTARRVSSRSSRSLNSESSSPELKTQSFYTPAITTVLKADEPGIPRQTQYSPRIQSEGEFKIARFLEQNSIKYHYESGVLVSHPKDKPRIWYPTSTSPSSEPTSSTFGLSGKQHYDQGIKVKQSIYLKMGLSVIPVFPWTFNEDWEGYIMKELESKTIDAYKNLMSKTILRQQGSCSQPYAPHHQRSHYKRFRNQY